MMCKEYEIEQETAEDAVKRLTHDLAQANKRIKELEETLKAIHPTFYGMLIKGWGPYRKWPKDSQGKYVYDKMIKALHIEALQGE